MQNRYEKGFMCCSYFKEGDTECIVKVEIKTLHHTKLHSLYKSCYSACIKDNKTYSSLLFSPSGLFKFVVKMALLPRQIRKTLIRVKFASKYMGSGLQAGEMP